LCESLTRRPYRPRPDGGPATAALQERVSQQAKHVFDRAQALEWLGLTLEQIERAVTMSASFTDNTGDFHATHRSAPRPDGIRILDYRCSG
jgi:hypothetical protein